MFDFDSDTRPKLPIKDILIKKDRGRKVFGNLLKLKTSIEEKGLIQPIVIDIDENEKYTLIAGETRLKACMTIPAMKGMIPYTFFKNLSSLKQKELELEENICRENLQPLEQIDMMRDIDILKRELYGTAHRGPLATGVTQEEHDAGWSLQKTADLAGVSATTASRQIALSKKLKERPDLRERVKNLPVTAMGKMIEQIEESERAERLHSTGQITISSNLQNTDALSFLRTQKDNSVDLFLTDPPFGMDTLDSRADDTFNSSGQSFIGKMKEHDNSTKSQVLTLLEGVSKEMYRVLKPGSHFYLFFELELLGKIKNIFESVNFTIQYPVLFWDKGRTTTPFRGYSYQSCYEAILFGIKPMSKPVDSPKRLNEAAKSILTYPPIHANKKTHIFEKPLDLLAFLIKNSSNYGDVVCDPFAGSGATIEAAIQTGRQGIGCEIDKEHFFRAQSRLLASQVEKEKK